MARKLKALPKYEDWKAAWEVDADGNDIPEEDQKFDAQRARKLIYDLQADRNRAQDAVAELTSSKEELEEKLANAADPKALETLQAEAQKAREEAEKAKSGGTLEVLKLRVALKKGLTESQARRLLGETEEEIEADADDLLKSFGGKGKDDEDDDDDTPVRRGPRSNFSNPADPDPTAGKGEKEPTPEEVFKRYQEMR